MQTVAVLVTRGSLNHLVQVVTACMAATVANASVRVLFRDESVLSITTAGAKELALSPALVSRAARVQEQLHQHKMTDVSAMLQTLQGHGDVALYACSSSMALYGVAHEELLPEIDAVRGLTAFMIDDVGPADKVFTF
jgi:peroxiredoxin family protein